MATPYSITILMSAETADELKNQGYSLFGFKAVLAGAPAGAAPLVWFSSTAFGKKVTVSWTEQYEAYSSTQQIAAGVTIDASNSYPIDLGQQLAISESSGTGSVVNGDVPTAIEISNTSKTLLTCGIGQMINGIANPLCAFPLHGVGTDVITPIEKVMLTFATKMVNTGTVTEQAFEEGALFDLTGNNNVTVTFDIDKGWSDSDAPMTPVVAKQDLASLLITTASLALVAAE
jgi:hypothetical protein